MHTVLARKLEGNSVIFGIRNTMENYGEMNRNEIVRERWIGFKLLSTGPSRWHS
jgi:hypothetical protein